MKNLACMNNCVVDSLRQFIHEHFAIGLVAGVLGACFGLAAAGIAWAPIGFGVGILLVLLYGCIPRLADCVDTCKFNA